MSTTTGRSSASQSRFLAVLAVLAVLLVLVSACSKDSKDNKDDNDAGDTDSDSDSDSDTDTDTDSETDSDTDSNTDTAAYQWHTFYGASGQDAGVSLAMDSGGNLYVTGSSLVSWDGPSGESPLHAHSGDRDIFVLALDI